jgi:hypothetical protein
VVGRGWAPWLKARQLCLGKAPPAVSALPVLLPFLIRQGGGLALASHRRQEGLQLLALTCAYGAIKGPRTEEFMKMKCLYRCALAWPLLNTQPMVPQSKHVFGCRRYLAFGGSSGSSSGSNFCTAGGPRQVLLKEPPGYSPGLHCLLLDSGPPCRTGLLPPSWRTTM